MAVTSEVPYGHQLHRGDAQFAQQRKTFSGSGKSALLCKRSHMQFVKDQILKSDRRPILIGPGEFSWIDDLRRAVYALWLVSRGRVGVSRLTSNAEAIESARRQIR